MENENQSTNHLKIVKSEVKKTDLLPLSHEELMAQISTKGTVQEREMCVIENLRRKGLV